MPIQTKSTRRQRILTTALELFNHQGSHKVSTNHIAQEMGISPGNLYYYFKNKEHVIRELLAQLIQEFDGLVPEKRIIFNGLDVVTGVMNATGDLIYRYRFIYIELAALLARDSLFKTMYMEVKNRRIREFKLFFNMLDAMGLIQHPVKDHECDALVFFIWTYAEGLVTALCSSDIPVTQAAINAHFKQVIYILKNYLQPAIWSELAQKLEL